jgi:hypothetical protein
MQGSTGPVSRIVHVEGQQAVSEKGDEASPASQYHRQRKIPPSWTWLCKGNCHPERLQCSSLSSSGSLSAFYNHRDMRHLPLKERIENPALGNRDADELDELKESTRTCKALCDEVTNSRLSALFLWRSVRAGSAKVRVYRLRGQVQTIY